MKTLLIFSLFFSSYLLSSEPGQGHLEGQHPENISILRVNPEGGPTAQNIFPGTGEGSTKPESGGRPFLIGVGARGPHEDPHEVRPGSGPNSIRSL